jgi:hypothetical protein
MLGSLPVRGAGVCLARVSRLAWAYVPMGLWTCEPIGHNPIKTNEV